MDKQSMIAFILEEYAFVKEENRAQFDAILLRLSGHKGGISLESLLTWEEDDLTQLHQILSGQKMTREYVPDMIQAYASIDRANLPSKISFGHIVETEQKWDKPRIHRQYGNYEVPQAINRLYELETELGRAMDLELGLIMQKYDFRYHCTPPDFIPFASSGSDGIHYCFVTDFGAVTDLEHACIAVVSPMDYDSEIWLVAKNIKDFLRLIITDRSLLYNNPATFADFFEKIREQKEENSAEQQSLELRKLKQHFGLSEIPDLEKYIQSVHEEREQAICIQTLDTIGVMPLSGQADYTADEPLSIDWNDKRALDDILQEASPEKKLAFIRDAQHKKLIMDDRRILRRCKSILSELELYHELGNLLEIID
ncbi:hypothetical protein [Bacillus sp. FJAT-28004]|uniref:hypothetical protein n=1 Tax=Bacillus sp. FJAT-28004 TaxID=1679165 RepID=UPI0006B52E2D|nr:hypothetical protein [Bacillus sp. FJAT-28004]